LNNKKAFTIVEFSIVLAISALLLYSTTISLNKLNFEKKIEKDTYKIFQLIDKTIVGKNGFINKKGKYCKSNYKYLDLQSLDMCYKLNKKAFNIVKYKNKYQMNLLINYSNPNKCFMKINSFKKDSFLIMIKCKLRNEKKQNIITGALINKFEDKYPANIYVKSKDIINNYLILEYKGL